jgi:hypothetical protein
MATTTQRGYGYAHKQRREREAIKVRLGKAFCPRCGRWIAPHEPWDLGHNPYDRTKWTGAEHRRCNRDTRLEKRLRRPRRFRAPAADWL